MEVEVDWTDETVLELIEDIRLHRCIWDPIEPSHRRKRKKQDVFFLLGNKYKCSPEEVSRKWANLLQTFRNLRRKMNVKASFGAEGYVPRWFAFEAINNFMKDVYTPRSSTDQGPSRTISDSNSDIQEDEESLDVKFMTPVEDFVLADESYKTFLASEKLPEEQSAPQNNPAKRSRTDTHNGVPSAQGRLTEPSRRAPVANDCYDSFGTYVAAMLRAIGPPESFLLQQSITVMMTNKMCAMENFSSERDYRYQS